VLPKDWRDENGKADWDGALAKIIHGGGLSRNIEHPTLNIEPNAEK
jgi:hypothetical protein